MPKLATEFQSLPLEYQKLILLAQEQNNITITPLQNLVGGWSGAIVYLVSVMREPSRRVEHLILKLDHKGKSSKSDEVTRHNTALRHSPPDFARDHIAQIVFERVEHEGAIAIFYNIAGQSLRDYRPLSSYNREKQLKTIFTATNAFLLTKWNANLSFEQAIHPQKVLEKWLGFRLDPGGSIERFLQSACRVDPDIPGFLINGNVVYNPLLYARKAEVWGTIRPMDVAQGFIHGDLNTNNILVKFSSDEALEGYYLIDFALFKEQMPLLYDQRYLEMSYLIHAMSHVSFETYVELITRLGEVDFLDSRQAPIGLAGVAAVLDSARDAFDAWVKESHPSLHDDLWGQYWLAGVAAGLSYCHKPGTANEHRLAGLIYAAANLKRYASISKLAAPTEVELLYDEHQADRGLPGAPKAKTPKHNLPAQPTPFIGRTTQIAAIKELLSRPDVRLVTLIGPGGTGKTRLALQVAADLMDRFLDGIYFIDLAPIREPEAVVATMARTVGLRETSDRALLEALKEHLQDQVMLLILDNFEQVTSAAPILADLLQSCPQLNMLITSREALHLRGEHVHPVPPLTLPSADHKQTSVEQLTQYEAVQLFIERALAVKPDFQVTNENAPAVAEICFRLDGLPLAIELAAARIRLFPPQALLERVGSRLKLLQGGARDLPVRQQTLRDTIDWSYEMLNAGEQRLFALLSVFAGCTFEAVESVAGEIKLPDGRRLDILDALASLMDKSLIRRADQGAEDLRLLMLETIKEYAAERLEQDAEFSAASKRNHAIYFADFTQRQWERMSGDHRETPLDELESELENLRIAWRYWVTKKDLERLNRLVNGLWSLYDLRGWYHATMDLTNDLLNVLASTPSTPERAEQEMMLQMSLARALMATKGFTEEAETAYLRALERCERAGAIPQLFPLLRGLASFYILRREHEKSALIGEQMLSLGEQLNDTDMRAEAHIILGYNVAFREEPQRGLEHLEKAIAMYDPTRYHVRRLGIGPNPGVTSQMVSALFLWMLGYPDRAHKRAADSILLARKLNHPYSIAYALFHTGLLNIWLRNYQMAQESALALLELAEQHGFQIWRAVGSCLSGVALVGTGSTDQGLALIEQGLKAYRGLKTPPVFLPLLLHLCASAYALASKPEKGLALMDEALTIAMESSARTMASEFLILKGALLLALSSDNVAEAESLYQQALENARDVHAPLLELRAAIGLSRLWQEQGNTEQARNLLSNAYTKLTEGFTTADLQEASTLLAKLSS